MQNTVTIVVVVFVILLALALFGGMGMVGFGGFGMGPGMMNIGMMNGMMGGYGYGYNPLGAILSLASWALILGGVALLVVYLVRNAKSTGNSSEAPLNLLKARYARGEITKDQFNAIRSDLGV